MDQLLSSEQILQAPTCATYYQTALEFCAFIEQATPSLAQDFLLATRRYLVRLYDAASALPWVDLQSNQDYDDTLAADTFQAFLSSIAERLGEACYYWHVFEVVRLRWTV